MKRFGLPVAAARSTRRATGIRQAEQLGGLVESLAQRIVDRRAPALVIADTADQNELGMAARNQQHEIGKGQAVGQPSRQRMSLEMVHRIKRLAGCPRDGLAGHQPDDQPTDQPGTRCRSHGIDLLQSDAGALQRLLDQAVQCLDVSTRGDLGNHAAIGAVLVELAQDHVAFDDAGAVFKARDDGRGRFVTARLDAENAKSGCHLPEFVDCDHPETGLRGLSVTTDQIGCKQNLFASAHRGSPLALAQAYETRNRLMAAHGLPEEMFEIVALTTKGDRITDRSLAEIGGKGLFTAELEEQLASGELDFAVHSSKDMPTVLPDGLFLSAFLPREDVRDAFVGAAAPRLV